MLSAVAGTERDHGGKTSSGWKGRRLIKKGKRKKEEERGEGKEEEVETVEVTLGGETNQDGDGREGKDEASFSLTPGMVSKTDTQLQLMPTYPYIPLYGFRKPSFVNRCS